MNCQQIQEQLEEYALGLLDPETRAQVETHLAECGECRALANNYADVLAVLPEALASVSPDASLEHLREKVLARIQTDPTYASHDTSHDTVHDAPHVASHNGNETIPPESRPVVRQQSVTSAPRAWAFPVMRTRMALILACLFVVIFLLGSIQLTVVLARERALRADFVELIGQQELVLEVIDSSHTERRVLLPPLGDSRAYGKVFSRDDMPHVVAMAARLTPAPAGQAYHLWLTRDNETILAGTLRTNPEGFGLVTYDDNMVGPHYTHAVVTLQALDSTAPQGPPILEWLPDEE